MKRVSVIGANSYIARNFISVLKDEYPSVEIDLYDRDEVHKDGLPNYHPLNILDADAVCDMNLDTDAIVLFTGKTGTSAGFEDYSTFVNVNEMGLLNILNAMRVKNSGAKLIFPSTRLVYKGQDRPLSEDDDKEAKTIYAANKLACERYLKMYADMFGIKYVTFRICVPYGTLLTGASSYGTAEFFVGKASKGEDITLYGDGELRRTFTYIGDICKILVKGCAEPSLVNDVFNIGGEDLSLKDMATSVAEFYQVGVSFIPWPEAALKLESGSTVFNSNKLDSLIGCNYNMTLREWIGGL